MVQYKDNNEAEEDDGDGSYANNLTPFTEEFENLFICP